MLSTKSTQISTGRDCFPINLCNYLSGDKINKPFASPSKQDENKHTLYDIHISDRDKTPNIC